MCELTLTQQDQERFVYKSPYADDEWAYDLWEKHEDLHWLPKEVPMKDDVFDWNSRLTDADRDFLTSILGFFVQADIEVHDTYVHDYLPHYNSLGVKQMLTGFAAREPIHIMGYAYGVESLLHGEAQRDVFEKFMHNENLMRLHNALNKYSVGANPTDLERYKHMVATTLFGEGVMLFGQFAMLLNYARNGSMRGLGQIVSWSIRDEDAHVYGVTQLMKRDKRFQGIDREAVYNSIHAEVFPLIKTFVEDCFSVYTESASSIKDRLDLEGVLKFLDYQAERRKRQAGISNAHTTTNPYPWFDAMVAGVEHANFFEQRATEYSKGNLTGDFEY